jgi:agmatine deiminase
LLRESRRRLETMTTSRGEPLQIIDLPMPGPVIREGQRMPASYANFYIGNRVVLLPVYGHRNDEQARTILQDCFPTRRVVPMDSRDLIWGLGSFHCVTQQQPA